jgi:hypothetical protein
VSNTVLVALASHKERLISVVLGFHVAFLPQVDHLSLLNLFHLNPVLQARLGLCAMFPTHDTYSGRLTLMVSMGWPAAYSYHQKSLSRGKSCRDSATCWAHPRLPWGICRAEGDGNGSAEQSQSQDRVGYKPQVSEGERQKASEGEWQKATCQDPGEVAGGLGLSRKTE